jgi:hypothetical protein
MIPTRSAFGMAMIAHDIGDAMDRLMANAAARHRGSHQDHIGTVLFVLTVVGCYGLLASGLL